MGFETNLELNSGTLYIKHHDNDEWQKLGSVFSEEGLPLFDIPDTGRPYIAKMSMDDLTMEMHCELNLPFRLRVYTFGFWSTVRFYIRRFFKRV